MHFITRCNSLHNMHHEDSEVSLTIKSDIPKTDNIHGCNGTDHFYQKKKTVCDVPKLSAILVQVEHNFTNNIAAEVCFCCQSCFQTARSGKKRAYDPTLQNSTSCM